MEGCKKVYQLDKFCNNQPPPCVLYECESENTTEMFMSIPETSTMESYGPSRIDHGSNFVKALGIIGCVVVCGLLIWWLFKKIKRSNTDQAPPLSLEYHPEVPRISEEDLV